MLKNKQNVHSQDSKQDKEDSHEVLYSPDKIILEWKMVCFFAVALILNYFLNVLFIVFIVCRKTMFTHLD